MTVVRLKPQPSPQSHLPPQSKALPAAAVGNPQLSRVPQARAQGEQATYLIDFACARPWTLQVRFAFLCPVR